MYMRERRSNVGDKKFVACPTAHISDASVSWRLRTQWSACKAVRARVMVCLHFGKGKTNKPIEEMRAQGIPHCASGMMVKKINDGTAKLDHTFIRKKVLKCNLCEYCEFGKPEGLSSAGFV